MPLSRRYTPELAPGETSVFGMSFEYIIPRGVGITGGALDIVINRPDRAQQTDVTSGPVSVLGRCLYATVTADFPASGTDYQLIWVAFDTQGNTWPRVGLVLCGPTS